MVHVGVLMPVTRLDSRCRNGATIKEAARRLRGKRGEDLSCGDDVTDLAESGGSLLQWVLAENKQVGEEAFFDEA
jgi:hypothetical protein